MSLLVQDISETELLAAFTPLLPQGSATVIGPGDDAAVVRASSGSFVVSTDVLVQDRHFRTQWSSGQDVGYRAAMQNLADIAAMGARPTAIVVGLVLPRQTTVEWVKELARGFAQACQGLDVAVVGGDLSGGEQLVIAVTVHGELDGTGPAVLRSGARVGDQVAVCGTLGLSAAGLWWLSENGAQVAPTGVWQEAVGVFRRPQSPLASGVAARARGARSMMDISDGLIRDAGRIAAASGVGIELDLAALTPYVARFSDEVEAQAWEWVLSGGEEHSLLATFAADQELDEGWYRVGAVVGAEHNAGGGALVRASNSGQISSLARVKVAQLLKAGGGWDHFG